MKFLNITYTIESRFNRKHFSGNVLLLSLSMHCLFVFTIYRGLSEVIHPDWLSIFSAPELQVIISGVTGSAIDVEDLKQNTRYAHGYLGPIDVNIIRFWNIVRDEMDDSDRAKLIRFVTSCERAPSLGFGSLQPLFTIQRVDSEGDSRLPSASTCFNILKLPAYSNQRVMREKLLYAIRSNAGFDLS